MQKFYSAFSVLRRRDLLSWIGCWSAGLLTGTYLAVSTEPTFFHGMLAALSCRPSIPGLLTATFLPFLLSACTAAASYRSLLLFVSFFRACVFMFVGTVLDLTYGSAGWLVRCLLQFSGIVTLPIFCWFCLRCYTGSADKSRKRDLLVCFLLTAAAVLADYFAVTPILIRAANP